MLKIDMGIYSATRDLPGGPMVIVNETPDVQTIEPYRDENGDVTTGGWIGYFLAYAVMAGGILYCMYLL